MFHPVPEVEQSVPSLKRNFMGVPAYGSRFTLTCPYVVCEPVHTLFPCGNGCGVPGVGQPTTKIVPLYPPCCMLTSASAHEAPLFVDTSSTPPSKWFSSAKRCQNVRVAVVTPAGTIMLLIVVNLLSVTLSGSGANAE